jgi:hypothetical protein
MSVAVTESTTVPAFFLICAAVSSARRTPTMTISSFFDSAGAEDVEGDEDCCAWDACPSGAWLSAWAAIAALAPHKAIAETPARKNAQLAACDRLPLISLSPLCADEFNRQRFNIAQIYANLQ